MKNYIIIGGSQGIGESTARILEEEGNRVLITGRTLKRLERLTENKKNVSHLLFDYSSDSDLNSLLKWIENNWDGKVDGLVNNAGAFAITPFKSLKRKQFEYIFYTNVIGLTVTTSALIPFLHRVKGSIVNVSSIAARKTWNNSSAYSSSKAALEQLTKVWAVELAPDIRVNAVAPGPTETNILINSGLSKSETEELRAHEKKMTPLKRIASSIDIANSICFLLSSNAVHITGQILSVDGGMGLNQ